MTLPIPKTTTILCILDGLGLNPNPEANAVSMARKNTLDYLLKKYQHTTLITHGESVGLPAGFMGNSEVGHLNIGAGRVVLQWLHRISEDIVRGKLKEDKKFATFLGNISVKASIHLIGLYSMGGVHSYAPHLHQLIEMLNQLGYENIVLHLILDGRDTAPMVAAEDVQKLQEFLKKYPKIKISCISGRFFAMDRDNRWERTLAAYKVIYRGDGDKISDIIDYIKSAYSNKISDEFIEPRVVDRTPITPEDGVILWNFRADRMRQLNKLLILGDAALKNEESALGNISQHPREKIITFTNYEPALNTPYIWEAIEINNHLGEVVSNLGLKQLRTAETEKYPHVTYFFSGGKEQVLAGEDRIVIPSPRDVKTYDLKPQMSAIQVKDVVIDAINSNKYDLIVVNFANCDMVGHTGILSAAISAVECVDACLGEVYRTLVAHNGQMLVIADHGNCEQMIDYQTHLPHTSHTTYPVPAILVVPKGSLYDGVELRAGGALCDVAPTILKIMGIEKPIEMSGRAL